MILKKNHANIFGNWKSRKKIVMYSDWSDPKQLIGRQPVNGFRDQLDPVREVNFHFKSGGLGDQICRLPAIKYAIENNKNLIAHLWVPDYFKELAMNSLLHELSYEDGQRIRFYSESEFSLEHPCRALPAQITDERYTITSLMSHLVDLANRTLLDQDLDFKYKNYLKVSYKNVLDRFALPIRRYAVICTGFTAPTRELLPETINAIKQHVINRGLIPVFLGASRPDTGAIPGRFSSDINFIGSQNLIDKTPDLIETAAILGRARVVIGLDNGLLHLAAMTRDTLPIVAGYTSVDPEFRVPIRGGQLGYNVYTVIPDETLECRGCQSKMSFIYKHDFRYCYYDDYACLSQLSVPKWIKQINNALGV